MRFVYSAFMRSILPLAMMLLALCSCKKTVPDDDLAAMEAAVEGCNKCLALPSEEQRICRGKAREAFQARSTKFTKGEGLDAYDQISKSRVMGLEDKLNRCMQSR